MLVTFSVTEPSSPSASAVEGMKQKAARTKACTNLADTRIAHLLSKFRLNWNLFHPFVPGGNAYKLFGVLLN
ncbi:Uncharacterised protein [Mycobacteroides abscessus subsp. abscessus]|nr:Uncharacterised protein [Mycobacteroides abscessus subsp. abscessus]